MIKGGKNEGEKIMNDENKQEFVKALGECLANHSRCNVIRLEYKEAYGKEFVSIVRDSGTIQYVDITGDSCIAIMQDVSKWLM